VLTDERIPFDVDDRAEGTLKSHGQFLRYIWGLPVRVNYHTVLQTDEKPTTHYRIVLKRRDANRLEGICSLRILQIHQQLFNRSPHIPDVPPLDRTIRRRREKLRVVFGMDPKRLSGRISLRDIGRLYRRK